MGANDREFFPTPDGLTTMMVDLAVEFLIPQSSRPARALEPSAGDGALVRALQAQTNWEVTAVEPHGDHHGPGWLKTTFEDFQATEPFDVVVMNPPFSKAQEHVQKGLELLRPNGVLVCLVPIGFLASQRRARFYRRFPPVEFVSLTPRPSFTPDGKTANSEYGILVWRKGHSTRTILSWRRWSPVNLESSPSE